MESGYLKIILGSMFAGKTTELIKEYNRHKACGFKCCFINSLYDDRYNSGSTTTKTHNKNSVSNNFCSYNLSDIFENVSDTNSDNPENYDVFFINEGQFFKDLYVWVHWLVNEKNKKVYVCGLDGDYQRKKFGSILDIIPLCDDIVKIKAICRDCRYREGIFTYRLSNERSQMLIGSDNYSSLCRKCFNNNLKLEHIEKNLSTSQKNVELECSGNF